MQGVCSGSSGSYTFDYFSQKPWKCRQSFNVALGQREALKIWNVPPLASSNCFVLLDSHYGVNSDMTYTFRNKSQWSLIEPNKPFSATEMPDMHVKMEYIKEEINIYISSNSGVLFSFILNLPGVLCEDIYRQTTWDAYLNSSF